MKIAYTRPDGAEMVEVAPHRYVNRAAAEALGMLARAPDSSSLQSRRAQALSELAEMDAPYLAESGLKEARIARREMAAIADTSYATEVDRQVAVARVAMKQHKVALSGLAKR